MVVAAEHLGVRAEVEAGQVEVGERVALADVEEEVGRPGVVAVLEHLDQREAEQAVEELDGALHVAADQGDVVHAPGARRRPLVGRLEVPGGDLLAACGERVDGRLVDGHRSAHADAESLVLVARCLDLVERGAEPVERLALATGVGAGQVVRLRRDPRRRPTGGCR